MYAQLLQDFAAFNKNAVNSIIYIVQSNLSLILTIAGAASITLMSLKLEIESFVTEEQNII